MAMFRTGPMAGGKRSVRNPTDKAVAQFNLSSSAFQNGGAIPGEFTCDGGGKSPPLSWSEPPPGTKSFALVVDDPSAPNGTFGHWGVWDIPASTRMIGSGQAPGHAVHERFWQAGIWRPLPAKRLASLPLQVVRARY